MSVMGLIVPVNKINSPLINLNRVRQMQILVFLTFLNAVVIIIIQTEMTV